MRIVRCETTEGKIEYGAEQEDGRVLAIKGRILGRPKVSDRELSVKKLLAPIDPVNIFAIGGNYKSHIEESGVAYPTDPPIFMKPTSSVIGPGDDIVLPEAAPDEVDYETELAIVIKKTARNVTEKKALSYVLGYTCANDVSARDCQMKRDIQWTRAKGFDTFCPLGPAIVTDLDTSDLRVRSTLNGKVMQDQTTKVMLFNCANLVSFLSHQFTLHPGTVIMTGTPEGVGFARKPPVFLRSGDEITVEVEGIGQLTNKVR